MQNFDLREIAHDLKVIVILTSALKVIGVLCGQLLFEC